MHRFSITVICHLSSPRSRQRTIRQIRAENRPKSRGKIWKRTKIFVPLHCQKLSAAAATIKTKNCED